MNAEQLQKEIDQLKESQVIRVACWVFDEERNKQDRFLSEATYGELSQQWMTDACLKVLDDNGLSLSLADHNPENIVSSLRVALHMYADQHPKVVEEMLPDLGVQAGQVEMVDFLVKNLPYLPILLLLCKDIKIKFKKSNNELSGEFKIENSLKVKKALKSLLKLWLDPKGK